MWTVDLWVFGKGWKRLGRFRSEAKARATVETFDPYETRLISPNGSKEWFGKYSQPVEYLNEEAA